MSARFAAAFTTCQIAFGVIPAPPGFAHPAYAPEDRAGTNFGGRSPGINSSLHPRRDRNRANVLSFADQVGYDPVLLPDLEVIRPKAH